MTDKFILKVFTDSIKYATKCGGIPFEWNHERQRIVMTKHCVKKWRVAMLFHFLHTFTVFYKTVQISNQMRVEDPQRRHPDFLKAIILSAVLFMCSLFHGNNFRQNQISIQWINFYLSESLRLQSEKNSKEHLCYI